MTFDDLLRSNLWSRKVTGALYLLNCVYFSLLSWWLLLRSRDEPDLKLCHILDICLQICINDISLEEHLSDICLFADDAVIGKSGRYKNEIKDTLHPCGNSIHTWCRQNQMVPSIKKTNTLFISSKHKSLVTCIPTSSVIIDQNKLEEVENVKLFGVFVDSSLSWKKTNCSCKAMWNEMNRASSTFVHI